MAALKYYVYHLINPLNNSVFYVGKGKGSRCKTHEQKVKRNPEKYGKSDKGKIILEILNSGGSVNISIVSKNINEEESLIIEEREIDRIGISNLTNERSKGGLSGDTRGFFTSGRNLALYWLSIVDCRGDKGLTPLHGVSIYDIHNDLNDIMMKCVNCIKMKDSFIAGMGEAFKTSKHPLYSVIKKGDVCLK